MAFHIFNVTHSFNLPSFQGFSCLPYFSLSPVNLNLSHGAFRHIGFIVYRFRVASSVILFSSYLWSPILFVYTRQWLTFMQVIDARSSRVALLLKHTLSYKIGKRMVLSFAWEKHWNFVVCLFLFTRRMSEVQLSWWMFLWHADKMIDE